MMLERVLRAVAVAIAILGLVDPALTLPWRERPIVGVVVARPSPLESRDASQPPLSAAEAEALQARVVTALGREFDTRVGNTPPADAAAVVLIGDGRSPVDVSLPATTVVSAVVPASNASGDVRIVRVDAPRRTHISERVPIAVHLDGRGLAGRTSTIVIRSDGLELARRPHTWRDAAERASLTIDAIPLHAGLTRYTVAVLDGTGAPSPARSPVALSSADVAVDVTDRPLRVLFVNARPSWGTQFIRRALEEDPRFAVSSATRVSRGVTATTVGAPVTLAAADADTFHAIVVGAPELLTKAEVDTLRTFARVRGGVVVVAPDRRPEGPVLELMPARDFTERMLAEPTELLAAGAGQGADQGARRTDRRLWTTELAVPRDVLRGTEPLLSLARSDDDGEAPATTAQSSGTGTTTAARTSSASQAPRSSPIVMASPLGDGAVIVSGALDAWRYRDRGAAAFDRFWRETIAARAQAVPEPVEVTLEPAVARPGERVEVTVRVRTMTNSGATAPITTATATTALATDATTATPVRLWPDSRPGAYHGGLNAPSQDGVYAVSVQLDGEATTSGRAALWVDDEVHVARPAWAGLQAFVDARHGQLVTADRLDRLAPTLRDALRTRQPDAQPDRGPVPARHPLRSAWWIVPFAGCLGGEWLLRRRRGAR